MRLQGLRLHALLGIALGMAAVCRAGDACGAAETKTLPLPPQIEKAVLRYFSALPDYKPGDIVSRSEVDLLFTHLKRTGWTPADGKRILTKVLPDNAFLLAQLRTRAGRKFMRRIASYPEAYDRLDRLSRLPYGKQTVHDLIHGAGGHEMIKYMTTTQGGKNLGKQLSSASKGRNFNKPTGRIYTVKMLLKHLEKSYQTTIKGEAVSTK